MSEKSWLHDLRHRYGWTQQPAKYISGFVYGFVFGAMLVWSFSLIVTWFGPGLPPQWILIVAPLWIALLMGFAE